MPDRVDGRRSRARGARRAGLPNRRAWGSMSREEIVSAGVRAARDGSFDQLSIRALAADLGASPMTLYRYVRDKDDLLDEVVGRLLAGVWRPDADPGRWAEWVTECAERLRRFLVGQPAALHVYLRHPVVSPATVERMDAMLGVLRSAGASEEEARHAYAAIHTYTIGFATLEASRAGWTAPQGDPVAAELAAHTTSAQFSRGLGYILEGFEQHLPAGPAAPGGAGEGRGRRGGRRDSPAGSHRHG